MNSQDNNETTDTISLGKTLLIVNPVAQSGKGEKAGKWIHKELQETYKQEVDLFFTQKEKHATDIVKNAKKYDSIVAVGGDGVVHEIVTGLMAKPKEERPKFGVIPVGSGNDYARSLGMKFKPSKAVEQLMCSVVSPADVGLCNGLPFMETLSFGVDAGIALGTMDLRKKTNQKGFVLYFESGINQIVNHFNSFNYKVVLDPETEHEKTLKGEAYIFAIQIGRTYGGGFPITPDAKIDDGIFNICFTKGHMSRVKALSVFALASKAKHVNRKCIEFAKGSHILMEIDRETPCQMDGEKYVNTKFDIQTVKHAIKVYKAPIRYDY